MKEELGRMVSPQAVMATVVGGLTMYAILLALPEPVSKRVLRWSRQAVSPLHLGPGHSLGRCTQEDVRRSPAPD
jgi:hypothetical protein